MIKLWTEREEQRLQQMVAEGWLNADIADYMGRTVNSVASKIKKIRQNERNGLGPRVKRSDSWSDEEIAKLIRMFEQGISTKRIAEELGRGWPATRTKITLLRAEGVEIMRRRRHHRQKAHNARRKHGINIGHISLCLFNENSNVTEEAADWIVESAAKAGCESVAEWLVELALDEYYEERSDGN